MSNFTEPTPDPAAADAFPESKTPTATGLSPQVCAGLAMLFPPVGGLVFYLLERKNSFVRFYSLQSIALGSVMILLNLFVIYSVLLLKTLPIIGPLLALLLVLVRGLLSLCFVGFLLVAVYQAFHGAVWEVPWLGKYVRRYQRTGVNPFTD